MKLRLIELEKKSFTSHYLQSLMPPILAAWAVREGWEVQLDFIPFEKVDYDTDCDVVALSTYTSRAPQSYEVARRFRERGKTVVIGGPHTKGCVDDVLLHADAVFRDCDETAWRGFLRSVEDGSFLPSTDAEGRGRFIPSAQFVEPPPYREYGRFIGKRKFPNLLASVGCPYECGFCTDWDSPFKRRDIDDVLQDVRDVGDRLFFFTDPNFGANPVATKELLRRMAPLKRRYFVNYSFSYLDDEVLTLLRDSGCMFVAIGLDSLLTTFHKNATKKGESILEDALRKIDRIKEFIPMVHVNLILGLDTDTEESFAAVREFHRRTSADIVMPHIATPFPGTPLHDEMKAAGRIFDWDESHYDTHHLVATLKQISPDRFYDLYIELLRELRSPWAAIKKAARQLAHSKNPVYAGTLLGILGKKSIVTWRHEIPGHRAAQQRLSSSRVYEKALEGRAPAPARRTALGYATISS